MEGFGVTALLGYHITGALKQLKTLRAGKCPFCGTAYIALSTVTTVICAGCGALSRPKEYKTTNEVMEAIGMPLQ